MSKTNIKLENAASKVAESTCCDNHPKPPTPAVPPKTKLEKTQSLLTVISTSIGLMGVAGSIFAYGVSSFYTGAVEVHPDPEPTDVVVRVITREGHESVFHTKHIELMPGSYHLEISSTDGRVVHADTKIRFHKTSAVNVSFARAVQAAAEAGNTPQQGAQPNAALAAATNLIKDFTNPIQTQQQQPTATAGQATAGAQPAAAMPNVIASAPPSSSPQSNAETSDKSNPKPKAKSKKWWQIWKRPIIDDPYDDDKQQ